MHTPRKVGLVTFLLLLQAACTDGGYQQAGVLEDSATVDYSKAVGRLVDARRTEINKSPCTVFAIGQKRAVTAGHCTLQAGTNDDQIKLEWNQAPGVASKVIKVTAHSYTEGSTSVPDYALLEIDVEPAVTFKGIVATTGQTALRIMGFPANATELTRNDACKLVSETVEGALDRLAHDCGGSVGMSGSPVFNANGEVVGVHTGKIGANDVATALSKFVTAPPVSPQPSASPGPVDPSAPSASPAPPTAPVEKQNCHCTYYRGDCVLHVPGASNVIAFKSLKADACSSAETCLTAFKTEAAAACNEPLVFDGP